MPKKKNSYARLPNSPLPTGILRLPASVQRYNMENAYPSGHILKNTFKLNIPPPHFVCNICSLPLAGEGGVSVCKMRNVLELLPVVLSWLPVHTGVQKCPILREAEVISLLCQHVNFFSSNGDMLNKKEKQSLLCKSVKQYGRVLL